MTREDLLRRLTAAGHTQRSWAALTGVSPVTVYQWGNRAPVPPWVVLLLDTLAERDSLRAYYNLTMQSKK